MTKVATGRGEAAMIEQGYDLVRPSRIEIRLHDDEVSICGSGVTVAQSVLRL